MNMLKNYVISKYHEKYKPASTLEYTNSSEIDVKGGTINHYEPGKVNGAFDDINTLNIKVKAMKIYQSNNILKRLGHIWVIRWTNI